MLRSCGGPHKLHSGAVARAVDGRDLWSSAERMEDKKDLTTQGRSSRVLRRFTELRLGGGSLAKGCLILLELLVGIQLFP